MGENQSMTNDELTVALETVVARTKVERYRDLCSDGVVSPWDQAGYQFLMGLLAQDPPECRDVTDAERLETPAARQYGLTGPPTCCGGSCSRATAGATL